MKDPVNATYDTDRDDHENESFDLTAYEEGGAGVRLIGYDNYEPIYKHNQLRGGSICDQVEMIEVIYVEFDESPVPALLVPTQSSDILIIKDSVWDHGLVHLNDYDVPAIIASIRESVVARSLYRKTTARQWSELADAIEAEYQFGLTDPNSVFFPHPND